MLVWGVGGGGKQNGGRNNKQTKWHFETHTNTNGGWGGGGGGGGDTVTGSCKFLGLVSQVCRHIYRCADFLMMNERAPFSPCSGLSVQIRPTVVFITVNNVSS